MCGTSPAAGGGGCAPRWAREFAYREELVAKIMAWIADYDRSAKPFAWTYNGQPLKVA